MWPEFVLNCFTQRKDTFTRLSMQYKTVQWHSTVCMSIILQNNIHVTNTEKTKLKWTQPPDKLKRPLQNIGRKMERERVRISDGARRPIPNHVKHGTLCLLNTKAFHAYWQEDSSFSSSGEESSLYQDDARLCGMLILWAVSCSLRQCGGLVWGTIWYYIKDIFNWAGCVATWTNFLSFKPLTLTTSTARHPPPPVFSSCWTRPKMVGQI